MINETITELSELFALLWLIPFRYLSSRPFLTTSTATSDPCEELNCTEYEWCGQKDGVYGCFCDEHHHRRNNESYGEAS